MEIVESFSPEDTFALGVKLGAEARPGQIYMLNGDLGVGKTVFTQGLARGLHIDEPVSSPTFTILQEYESGRLPLYHFDVYRLGEPEELEEIGCDDYFFGNGVCLIEWAERIREWIPDGAITVIIEKDLEKGFDYRRISLIF
jgi:tRNA threonylcarbamoyladenosine biosynthesis protein TsaE